MDKEDWKVLLIDDEEAIRRVVSIALADEGYQMLTAADGESGLRLCKEESPQIVITDIRMPGMDGIEVLQRVKDEDPDKEVIVITGFGDMGLAVKALQADASDFVTKPIENEALLVALERAQNRYTNRRALNDYTAIIEERWMETAEELARTFDFQNNLIESSIDGIMGCDRNGKVVLYNKSLEKMLGYQKEEVIKKMSFDQFFPVGAAEQFREKLYSEEYGGENRIFFFETNLVSKNAMNIPVQLSATVLHEGDEEIGIVSFFRDLREIKRMEQQFADETRLLHQDKMISLGRLAASVVHEINNPLAGILNYARLMIKILKRGVFEQEQAQKFQGYLSLVERETDRCSVIVSNLLTFSRKSKMESGGIAINDLLEKCIMLSQHKLALQNIKIRTDLGVDIPVVWGDFNQMQQCVINLIFNAIDAMPEGGELAIVSSHDPKLNVVKIRVEDNGCGISKEDLPNIFDPFFTTKIEGKGLGLGLSTVYGIIDRHMGNIDVKSKQGEGTTVTVNLPAYHS